VGYDGHRSEVLSPEMRQASGLKTFPRRMEWNGQTVTFAEAGLRMLVRQGSKLVQLFDMTDDSTTYRLRRDGSSWTLVGTRAGA